MNAFLADEAGATAIEYCIIAAAIAVAIIALVNGLGMDLAEELPETSSKAN